MSNLFLTLFFVNFIMKKNTGKLFLWIWISLIIIPSAISIIRYYTIREEKTVKNEFVLIQPNIDPFTEKFKIPFEEQLKKTIRMAEPVISGKTAWVITPETTIDDPVNEDDMTDNKYISSFRDLALRHPGINIISGLVSYRIYSGLQKSPTNSARKIDSTGSYYDHFNSAFLIDTSSLIRIYHKSKLVAELKCSSRQDSGNF